MTWRNSWLAMFVVASVILSSPATSSATSRAQAPSRETAASAAPRDLAEDERAGGHTLARHVGKSDAELAARLARERDISAASTYTDAATAAIAVGTALAQSKARVDSWLARHGSRPNLVLNYFRATGPPIGRSLGRGQRTAVACYRALVVLRWDNRRGRWYVLTSYPET